MQDSLLHPLSTEPRPVQAKLSQHIIQEAAMWLMRLNADEVREQDRRAFEDWCRQSPEHRRAWKRIERLADTLQCIPPRLGTQTLDKAANDRRQTLKTLLLLAGVVPMGWVVYRTLPQQSASYITTATGERRNLILDDGSQIALNTATTLDIRFDETRRLLILRRGEVMITTSADVKQRPFMVETVHGRLRALGTRFAVSQLDESHTQLSVLEGAVEVTPHGVATEGIVVKANQQLSFSAIQSEAIRKLDVQDLLWEQGLLQVDNRRLGDFISELSRYRSGVLRCDPAVADLRISGMFRLDDTNQILTMLSETLPVQVTQRTRYWVVIGPREN